MFVLVNTYHCWCLWEHVTPPSPSWLPTLNQLYDVMILPLPLLIDCFNVLQYNIKRIICALFEQNATIVPKQHQVEVCHMRPSESMMPSLSTLFYEGSFSGVCMILVHCISALPSDTTHLIPWLSYAPSMIKITSFTPKKPSANVSYKLGEIMMPSLSIPPPKCDCFWRMISSCWLFQYSTIRDQVYPMHPLW